MPINTNECYWRVIFKEIPLSYFRFKTQISLLLNKKYHQYLTNAHLIGQTLQDNPYDHDFDSDVSEYDERYDGDRLLTHTTMNPYPTGQYPNIPSNFNTTSRYEHMKIRQRYSTIIRKEDLKLLKYLRQQTLKRLELHTKTVYSKWYLRKKRHKDDLSGQDVDRHSYCFLGFVFLTKAVFS